MNQPTDHYRTTTACSKITAALPQPWHSARAWSSSLQRVCMTIPLLAAGSLPIAAAAQGPATEATCEGIKAAYPILGASCAKNYQTIAESKTVPELDPAQKLALYQARVAVMQIFRKALLCNGLAGANKAAQQHFKSGEPGHLEAINNLYTSMGAANRPKKVFDADDLNNISINKQQCK